MGNKISIGNILVTLDKLPFPGDSRQRVYSNLNESIGALRQAYDGLNEIKVGGKESLDTLLGCILAIEMIIGDTENKGE